MPEVITEVLQRLAPSQGGALLLGSALTMLLAAERSRLFSLRNVALLVLLFPQWCLLETIDTWERHPDHIGARIAFTALFVGTLGALTVGFVLSVRRRASGEPPLRERGGLPLVFALLFAANLCAIFGRLPDDVGMYTNLGAQRWVETGTLPYGDPDLRGEEARGMGAAATYGPLLYAAHVPFQMALGARRNPAKRSTWSGDPMAPRAEWRGTPAYLDPPPLASQLVTLCFWVLGLWALFGLGKGLAGDPRDGWLLCCLYACAPCVFGLGGEEKVLGGLPFLSHIAPTAMMLLALRAHRRAWLSGLLLAIGAGILFFPAFFFPLWAVWFFRRGQGVSFTLGFVATGASLLALLWFQTQAAPDRNAFQLFLSCTLEHQEGGAGTYGVSKMGFWGQNAELTRWWTTPLTGGTSLLKPSFLAYVFVVSLATGWAWGRSVAGFAALVGVAGAAIQIWKTHAQGSYVEWYLPFLLLALVGRDRERGEVARSPAPARLDPTVPHTLPAGPTSPPPTVAVPPPPTEIA